MLIKAPVQTIDDIIDFATDDVIKVYLESSSKAMVDREKNSG